MIKLDAIFPIGKIIKPHGVTGEMMFTFTSDVFEGKDFAYFIIEIDGIFVPFFIAEFRYKTSETAFLKLDGIDTEMAVRELSGKMLYAPKKFLESVENDEIGIDYFVDFQLIEKSQGKIGIITKIDTSTANTLLFVQTADDEILIPFNEDFITDIHHKKKIITVDLPEGLLDL
jgi:16S rRNA processing protein RimM